MNRLFVVISVVLVAILLVAVLWRVILDTPSATTEVVDTPAPAITLPPTATSTPTAGAVATTPAPVPTETDTPAPTDTPLPVAPPTNTPQAAPPPAEASTGRVPQTPADLPFSINLPPGFEIDVYARGVGNARSMTLSPSSVLYVGSRGAGNVYAVLDQDKDYVADEVVVIARGLRMPNGVAFHNGALYVAEIGRVLRFDDIEANLRNPPSPTVVNDSFPTDEWHGWKFIRIGPDNKLYVPVGAPCNVCEPAEPYATISRMNLDGSGLETFASGVRNSVGFDWQPGSGQLWFTDNGRDNMGDNLPPDELNHAPAQGLNFGFPYCHGGDILDPQAGNGRNCADYVPPAQRLGPHVAALGMRFYTGNMFPPEYANHIFIAEHGSWNRSEPIGYRITLVRVQGNQAVSYETFADGWLAGGRTWGRPVDLEVMPDGSMLVSDDSADTIYRISYGQN